MNGLVSGGRMIDIFRSAEELLKQCAGRFRLFTEIVIRVSENGYDYLRVEM
jgi:hypothetical protein